MDLDITAPIFNDEEAARAHFEAIRWPDGRYCPHCGVLGNSVLMKGKTTRPGLYNCRSCDKPFTATVGTIFERSHIPMHKWLLAVRLMASSKSGMSAHQLFRMLGFGSYRTAWFMAHRIRESMRELFPEASGPLGGEGQTVEVDETYIGGKEKFKHRNKRSGGKGAIGKEAAVSLVERKGRVRSFYVGPEYVNGATLRPLLEKQLDRASRLVTDESGNYITPGRTFSKHETVNHGIGEYVRGDVHTNTIENYFSILKRGIVGTYRHVSATHLKRYLAEFDFRYNERAALEVTDQERADKMLLRTVNKRLLYQRPDKVAAEAGI